ncbi:MAG: bifunctional [glutamine synthetase] adenylyltransferase/[glutamine synthetase]-adenylyl-L-tyrosine phosphorylase, partial [Pseudomonadota bacterium]
MTGARTFDETAEVDAGGFAERLDWSAPSETSPPLPDPLRDVIDNSSLAAFIAAVCVGSPYLRGLACRHPTRLRRLLVSGPELFLSAGEDALAQVITPAHTEPPTDADVMRALRAYKRDVALAVALADLGGLWSVDEVTRALSRAADIAVRAALTFLFSRAAQQGRWDPGADDAAMHGGFFVLAMGKHGACELNYSSDIDLIVLFDVSEARVRDRAGPQTFFVRLTRDLARLLQEQTEDGYVFRVDLRLRPDPRSTQVAMSTEAALIYYENYGQNWERAAFIKARVIAGDTKAGEEFLSALQPFVWRKYLDYAAVADVHAMKRQINAFNGFDGIDIPGHDVKLGPGGIREIEFFVQTQQLIAGGRQPELRVRGTVEALERLAANGWITEQACDELTAAYCALRCVEHRLQMVDDQQTHTVPTADDALASIAWFAGARDVATFEAELGDSFRTVRRHYAALFEDVPSLSSDDGNLIFAGEQDDPETLETLATFGFSDPPRVIATVRSWHTGRYRATASERARESLTKFQPLLIAALSAGGNPDQALAAFDRFLGDLPAGIQLFSLLEGNPELLRLLADIMGSAPRLAQVLARRSRTLEAMLDPLFYASLPTRQDLRNALAVARSSNVAGPLDAARIVAHEQRLQIGVRLLAGTIDARSAGVAFSLLAETVIDDMLTWAIDELAPRHGRMRSGRVAVLGMGKLGGADMTATSDVDLILVYDHDAEERSSDGPRPLAASQYYARVTQRLIAALSAPTAEGVLYEVDMRLRPSGNAGPVATSLSAFRSYQLSDAWTWEHL